MVSCVHARSGSTRSRRKLLSSTKVSKQNYKNLWIYLIQKKAERNVKKDLSQSKQDYLPTWMHIEFRLNKLTKHSNEHIRFHEQLADQCRLQKNTKPCNQESPSRNFTALRTVE